MKIRGFASAKAASQQCIAVIPCRGGSKRIPRKNMYPLGGKPLMWHILHTARASNQFDRIMLATDDDEFDRYASELGFEVFRVPTISDEQPVQPLLQQIAEQYTCRALAYLRATSPLVASEDIVNAVGLLDGSPESDSVVAVQAVSGAHPSRFKQLEPGTGVLLDAFPEFAEGGLPLRSETLTAVVRSGALAVIRPETLKTGSLYGQNVIGYGMPEERSVDINTPFDMKIAQMLYGEGLHN